MEQKYPKVIRIGFIDYELSFVPEGMKDAIDGHHYAASHSIKICENTSGQYRAFVVLHEILHGCFFSSALSEAKLDDKEELIVDALSKALCNVIRDNPKLLNALTKDLK